MLKKLLFILALFVISGCDIVFRYHEDDILHLNPTDNYVVAVQVIEQRLDNESKTSIDEVVKNFIKSYNTQNNTNFTAFISDEPINTSRITLKGTLVEIR